MLAAAHARAPGADVQLALMLPQQDWLVLMLGNRVLVGVLP